MLGSTTSVGGLSGNQRLQVIEAVNRWSAYATTHRARFATVLAQVQSDMRYLQPRVDNLLRRLGERDRMLLDYDRAKGKAAKLKFAENKISAYQTKKARISLLKSKYYAANENFLHEAKNDVEEIQFHVDSALMKLLHAEVEFFRSFTADLPKSLPDTLSRHSLVLPPSLLAQKQMTKASGIKGGSGSGISGHVSTMQAPTPFYGSSSSGVITEQPHLTSITTTDIQQLPPPPPAPAQLGEQQSLTYKPASYADSAQKAIAGNDVYPIQQGENTIHPIATSMPAEKANWTAQSQTLGSRPASHI